MTGARGGQEQARPVPVIFPAVLPYSVSISVLVRPRGTPTVVASGGSYTKERPW